jgi:serine/threonine protein kinase
MTSQSHTARVDALFLQALELDPEERQRFLRTECEKEGEVLAKVEALLDAEAHRDQSAPQFLDPAALNVRALVPWLVDPHAAGRGPSAEPEVRPVESPATNEDHNLLYGVLALQLDLIDANQFAEACAAWAARKNVPLAQLLTERGWLDAEGRADVEKLLARKVKKHQGDVRSSLAEAADPHVRELMSDIQDGGIQRTVSLLPPGLRRGFVEVKTLEFRPETRSHYTLTRIHGQGGLGRVWIAHDLHLNRNVALKEILPHRQRDPVSERRFVREAQVTGQLEHPNIVPVYELAHGEKGKKLFYAMRYVEGQTLRAAIKEHHRQREEGAGADVIGFRQLLSSFIDVCHAVGYAHSRGVIHRDLKPANVMLGAFGEVTVLDWGLAKLIYSPSEEDGEARIDLAPLAEDELTKHGEALGSLPYMAPEQADSRRGPADRRTDVYGLGAILFEILTSVAPHQGLVKAVASEGADRHTRTQKLLREIARAATPRAGSLRSSVPAALDAVCAKAMAADRSERYGSAQALADDVQRWLADEPVSVHREPWSHRAFRWMRRHKAWTQSVAASLVTVTVIAFAALFFVDQARRAESAAKEAERAAKDDALRRFREARDAVDTMATGVGEALRYQPGTLPLRARLVESAADFYERLVEGGSTDPDVLIESGRALIRLGDLYRAVGQDDKTNEAFRRALNRFDGIDAGGKDRANLEFESFECLLRLAEVQTDRAFRPEDWEQAAQSLIEAETRLEPLNQSARKRCALARLGVARALVQQGMGRIDEALALLDAAERVLENLAGSDLEGRARYQECLARALSLHGDFLVKGGRQEEAIPVIEEATRMYQALAPLDEEEVVPRHLECLVASHLDHANALRGLGHTLTEEDCLKDAIVDAEALFRSMPHFAPFIDTSATCRAVLGRLYHHLGRNNDAKEQLGVAVTRLDWLVQYVSPHEEFRANLAIVLSLRGQILSDLGDPSAEQDFERARDQYEQLLGLSPDVPAYWRGRAMCERLHARLLHASGQADKAATKYADAMNYYGRAEELDGRDSYTQDGLATCLEHLGDLLAETGQEATGQYEKARSIRRELCRNRNWREDTYSLARLELKLGAADEALELASDLVNSVAENPRYRGLLGAAQYRAGNAEASVGTLQKPLAQALADGSREFWLSMALAARNQDGDRDKGRSAFQKGLELMGQNAPARFDLISLRDEAADKSGSAD